MKSITLKNIFQTYSSTSFLIFLLIMLALGRHCSVYDYFPGIEIMMLKAFFYAIIIVLQKRDL